jgi:hypothetical protein
MSSVHETIKRSLKQVSQELRGSLLYLDVGAAEAVATGIAVEGSCHIRLLSQGLACTLIVWH